MLLILMAISGAKDLDRTRVKLIAVLLLVSFAYFGFSTIFLAISTHNTVPAFTTPVPAPGANQRYFIERLLKREGVEFYKI